MEDRYSLYLYPVLQEARIPNINFDVDSVYNWRKGMPGAAPEIRVCTKKRNFHSEHKNGVTMTATKSNLNSFILSNTNNEIQLFLRFDIDHDSERN